MRILLVTATRVGDAMLPTGIADHLLRAHSAARITVARGPVAAVVFQRMPQREATLILVKRRFDLRWLNLWRSPVGMRGGLVVELAGQLTLPEAAEGLLAA